MEKTSPPATSSQADGSSSSSSGNNKRRKLRKGTHSCWECKRRKMRCEYPSRPDAHTCYGCQRRGCPCVSQEISEELSFQKNPSFAARILNSEIKRKKAADTASSTTAANSATTTDATASTTRNAAAGGQQDLTTGGNAEVLEPSNAHLNYYLSRAARLAPVPNKHERLSAFLHAALPPHDEVERICKSSRHPTVLPHQVMTMPYTEIDKSFVKAPFDLLDIPGPTEHPVLIARYMLLLASVIPHIHPDLQHELEGVSEPPRVIMDRLAHLATSLVTTNDALVGSIEGLQCVVTEAIYQTTRGNLRKSWVSCRRAITIAQLMGLNRPPGRAQFQVLQPGVQHNPQMLWFRIMCLDRLLCLMLGLSQGSPDRSMASEALLAGENDLGRLERIHCVIASRIIERNESHTGPRDDALTSILDSDLQKAAKSMPSKFWLVPALKTTTGGGNMLFWETRQIFAQVLHFNLLNQLHLPYMLRSSIPERQNEYSRITCINASREIIYRFITLHGINGFAYACRIIDFLTLMATMTLLLAHLHCRCLGSANLLSHQRYSDRAMIEQVQEIMLEVNRLNSDPLSAQSADLLRRLLVIEADAANDAPEHKRTVSIIGSDSGATPPSPDAASILSVHIPYFGIITVAREGISKEVTRPYATMAPGIVQSQRPDAPSTSENPLSSADSQMHFNLADSIGVHGGQSNMPSNAAFSQSSNPYAELLGEATSIPHPLSTAALAPDPLYANPFDPVWQSSDYPGLAAGGEDWAFQGMDSAFFDRLMSAVDAEDNV